MKIRYAHLADLHLGSWRDQKMRDLSTKAFLRSMDECVEKKVDFILFAGDLFNTSLPSLDTLKIVTAKLKELNNQGIPFYAIAGSHDFSPSGKTMLEILEKAGLLTNVSKGTVNPETKELILNFTTDPNTNVKITGLLGRKGMLDKAYYEHLFRENLEQEPGYKIFMFHTTISELLPNDLAMIESQPLSFLPKNFNYYAGGHIHHPNKVDYHGNPVTYTGALFPNNFSEVEKYSKGGYYIIDVETKPETEKEVIQQVKWHPLEVIKHLPLNHNCNHQTPEQIFHSILENFASQDLSETILTIRLTGKLEQGKISDINFKEIFNKLYSQGAYFIMKNTSKLNSEDFSEIKISQSNPETVEEDIIKEHLQQIKLFDQESELNLTKNILSSLNTSKKEGETITDFQRRISDELNQLLRINNSLKD